MTEVFFPSQLKQATSTLRYIDATGLIRGAYTGAVQTTAYGGDRIGATINIAPVGMAAGQGDRAVLRAFLAALKGKQGRLWLRNDSYQQRGSFPSAELLSNYNFANGTAGWTVSAALTMSVNDRVARFTRNAIGAAADATQTVSGLTQYAPYLLRAMTMNGRGTFASVGAEFSGVSSSVGAPALISLATVTTGTSLTPGILDNAASGNVAGDYFESPFVSLSRCALVDNAPNLLLRSDDQSLVWTANKLSVVSPNTVVAPDGTTTGTVLIEDGTAGSRYVTQSGTRVSAVADLCAYGFYKRGVAGTRNVALNVGNDLSNGGYIVVDLGLGTIAATVNFGTGTNTRGFVVPAGNGWYYCAVVCRLPAATTIINASQLSNGTTLSYAGDSNSRIDTWRCGAAVSSLPVRPGQTFTTAFGGGSTQTGTALYVKGLPVSTNGLLLPGDWVQVGNQIVMITASLNSDAAGLGYLQFSPPLRTSPADNDPVIVNQPMGKFIFSGQFQEWLNQPGLISSASLDLEESCD